MAAGKSNRMRAGRAFHSLACLTLLLLSVRVVHAQEGVFLSEADAPGAVFPLADRFERTEIPSSDALKQRMRVELGSTTPSIWEVSYPTFLAWQGQTLLGRAFFVEEIGKHRPITFVIGIRTDGSIADVAVIAYREAYGGEIRSKRFLKQFEGKKQDDSLQRDRGIVNIAGSTLSVDAAARACKKALALAKATEAGQP